jgi:ATP-binding cassette subfamily G (WHITE) protein 2 (PDR)
MLSAALGDAAAICRDAELLVFAPVNGQTCTTYMEPYIAAAGGYLVDGSSTTECHFCTIANTNVFLNSFSYDFANRWVSLGSVP